MRAIEILKLYFEIYVDSNSRDLTKAEDIKKRWQEYTELYKKDLHDPDNKMV